MEKKRMRPSDIVIAAKIRQYREERGMSQIELAKACGYTSRSWASKIENGDRIPNTIDLFKIAKALDIKASDLMGSDIDEVVNLVNNSRFEIGKSIASFTIPNSFKRADKIHIVEPKTTQELTDEERTLINSYRKAPENYKTSVKALLDMVNIEGGDRHENK